MVEPGGGRSARLGRLRPSDVVIEITERVGIARQDSFQKALEAFKARGYRVAVDDVGAGHASLKALAAIQPDFLKFDVSLVRGIDRSRIKQARGVSRLLADKMNARVIAEGVEREEELPDARRARHRAGPGLPLPSRGEPLENAKRRSHPSMEDPEAHRGRTVHDLADLAAEHGVTERTIRRDIEALQEAGFPLYDERADGRKIWRLVDGYKQRLNQTFTLSELSALYFGKNLMSFLGGAPFAQELESAFAKIQEALPVQSLPYLQRIQELFSARPDPWKDYSRKQDAIPPLIDATLHQRQARIAYFSFNSKQTKTYTLDPYRLVYFRGGLYLYARAHEYGEVRTFAVERIEKIEVLDLNFEVAGGLRRHRIREGRLRDRGRQAGAGGAGLRRPHGRLHPRARLAREPGDGGGARRLDDPALNVAPGLELQVLDQGLPAPCARGPAGRAARRDLEGPGQGGEDVQVRIPPLEEVAIAGGVAPRPGPEEAFVRVPSIGERARGRGLS